MKYKIPDQFMGKPLQEWMKEPVKTPEKSTIISAAPAEQSFILSYDGPYKDFAQELIRKNNELFSGTKAEILLQDDPLQNKGEVQNMYILKRLGLITTIYKNPLLQIGLYPITPLESETLLNQGKLPKPEGYWEDLALILWSTQGANQKEAQALYKSIEQHMQELKLEKDILNEPLLIINSGIEKSQDFPYRVKPIVLPGLTQVIAHESLKLPQDTYNFDFGLDNGLPGKENLDKETRTFYINKNWRNGIRVLCRGRSLDLSARDEDLVGSDLDCRVNFSLPKAAKKI